MCRPHALVDVDLEPGARPVDARQRSRLDDAGRILDALASITDATHFITCLRGPGGLDEYHTDYEQAFGETEKIEREVLEQAGREAAGRTVAECVELFKARRDALRAIRDDVNGIEVTTIHRAKGREWPGVNVFGCDEKQLPYRRALEVSEQECEAGEGLEAERRLAYVAFTRAGRTLVVHTTEPAASRFLSEAGLEPQRPSRRPAAPQRIIVRGAPLGRSEARIPRSVGQGPVAGVIEQAHRMGSATRCGPPRARTVALEAAAAALEHGLVGGHMGVGPDDGDRTARGDRAAQPIRARTR